MADVDPTVMSAVEAAIHENPSATVDELFALAKELNPATAELSKRQFHAQYPLQVKRRMQPPRRRRRKLNKNIERMMHDGTVREAVRAAFLSFASDLAAAEDRKDVVHVVASVDRYVEEVLEATHK
jgi:hypothetical protein